MISSPNPIPPASDTTALSEASGPFTDDQLVTLWSHASLLYHSRKWKQADECFSYCAMQTSNSLFASMLIVNVGIIATQSQDYERALKFFGDAACLADNARHTKTVYHLALFLSGNSLYELQHYQQAKNIFKECQTFFSFVQQVIDFSTTRTTCHAQARSVGCERKVVFNKAVTAETPRLS